MRTFGHNYIPTHSIVTFVLMLILVSGSLFFFTDTTVAAPNYQMNYQGKLTDASNVAVPDGTYNMRFWILTSNSIATTSAEWTESLTGTNRVQVTNGLFSVMLGSTSPLTGVDFNQMLYLGVEIGSTTTTPVWDGEMSPRKILGTVPAAFEARQLDGLATTSFLRADQDDTATGLLTFLGTTTHATSTFALASTTNLRINGETFSGLTGTGLTNTNGFLTVATNTLGLGDGSLSGLTDTDLTGVATGSLLVYDGGSSTWVKRATSSLGIKNTTGPTLIVAASDSLDTTRADYVADGTNDEEQIQAAIDALPAGGGTVQLLEGTFNVGTTTYTDRSINLATGTRLIGQGPSTVIRLQDGHNNSINIIEAENNDSVVVSSLKVDGNRTNNLTAGTYAGVYFSGVSSSTVQDVYSHNFQDHGINLVSSDENRLIGNDVNNNGNHGIYLSSANSNVLLGNIASYSGANGFNISGDRNSLNGNTSNNNTFRGFHFDSTNNTSIVGNTARNNGTDGFQIDSNFSSALTGNTAVGNGDAGIEVSGLSDSNTISSNALESNAYGIKLQTAWGNTLSGNAIKHNSLGGIYLSATTLNTSIIGNFLYENGGGTSASIYVEDSDDNIISSNNILATGTAALIEINNSFSDRNVIGVNVYTNNDTTTYISDSGTDTRYTDQSRITLTTATERAYSIFTINASSSSSTAEIQQLGSGDILNLYNSSSQVFTVLNGGNVGIGTTSPSSRLDIWGNLTVGTSSTPLLYVDSSTGNVGVGTANPTTELEVVGDIVSKGTSWTTYSAATSSTWVDIAYGNGRFVALGSSGTYRVMYSSDGVNWATTTIPEDNTWRELTYGNGLFVAVSSDGTNRVMTSPDGINWTARSAAEANSWQDVTYGDGLFVATAAGGTNRVMTSPDGITWTARSAAEANFWNNVTYGNGLFVAVSSNGTNRVMTSPDGITWTARSAAGNDDGWADITYGNGLFVAVGSSGDIMVMTSPDGITWTARSAVGDNDLWSGVTYGNGLFVAVGTPGGPADTYLMTSPDGITWTARSEPETNSWESVIYGNGRFVAVSQDGTNQVMTSGQLEANALANNNNYQGGMQIFGNVGIGTSSPLAQLHLNTAAGIDAFRVGSSSTRFLIDSSGKVGLGTTTPNQLLSVAGSMHLSGAFFDSTYASGTNGMVLLSTGAGTTWVATNTLGISGGAATLDGLTDTDLTGVATGSVLVYDGGSATWVSRATSTLGIAGGSDTNTSGPTLIVAASDSLDTTRADYVADGTNDQDTIEQALAALPAGGGTVQLLEGTFNINNAIDITQASTSLIGSGPATLLKITATSTSWDVIDVASAAATHHVYIGNLAIDGSAALAGSQSGIIFNAATSTIEGVAISNMRGPGVQIYEVSVKFVNNVVRGSTLSGVNANAHNSVYAGNILENNGQYGLTYQGNYSVIANNISSENTDSGIYAQYSNDNVFVGNTTKDNGQAGFEITLSDNNTVMGNTASGNTTYGIVLDNSAEYNTVSGNTFDSNSSVGVYITYSALNTITGNTVRGNLYGIVAEESNNNTISSNLLSGNGGGTNASIWMYSNSTDNIITGNNIVSTGSGALIQIDSGSNRNYVANNFYENPDSTTYITDNGTDTRYTDQSRITLSTATERAYSIFTINASSSSSTAEIQQLGSGDILNLYNSSSQVFTVDNNGYVGIGTTTPTAKFALTGTAGQTSPLLRISSSTEAVLFEIMSDGSFDVGSGALYYDVATNETSIERLNLGAIKFEDSAGWVSWIDVAASTSASAGDILAYTAQIDSQDILTLYSEQDGSGGIGKVRVVVGTSSAALYNSTNIPGGSFIVSDGIICVDDGGDNCDDAPRARGGLFATTTTVTAIDLAENYPTKDAALSAGELAMLDPENPVFVTTYDRNASTTREDSFIGVVSTAPGVLLGGWGSNAYDGELQVPITLSGRVPVKVNFEGGDILPGDRIAFSSVAGVGMRATTSGITAGIALEPYIATSTSASTTEGTIVVFVNNAYHTPKSQFVIDGNGNVAFGTSTDPNFKVKVGGDIAATGFINISASSTKRDIAHLDDGEKASLLEAIRDVDVATYNYKSEASSSPKRLGLIAEEAPSAVLSVDGKGVDLYKLATLAILGVQQNDDRLTKLEASLGELLATSTEASGVSLLSRLTELARNFVNGVLTLAGLHTQELCVGDTCVDEATFLKMVQDSGGVATTPTLDETDGSDEIGTTTDTGTEDVGTSTPGVVTDETTDSATTTPSGEGGDNVTETSEDSNPQPEEQVDSPVPQVPNNNSGVQSDTGTTTTE